MDYSSQSIAKQIRFNEIIFVANNLDIKKHKQITWKLYKNVKGRARNSARNTYIKTY